MYERFSDIAALTRGGLPTEYATAAVNNGAANIAGSANPGELRKSALNEAKSLVGNTGWLPVWVSGSNTVGNTPQVAQTITRRAALMYQAGLYPDVKSAVAAVARDVADPKVSTLINGTRYMNHELPPAPKAEDTAEYFTRFIKAVPGEEPNAKPYGLSQLRLEYSPATGTYTPMLGGSDGVPLTANGRVIQYTKERIQAEYQKMYRADVDEALEAAAHKQFVTRMNAEIGKMPAYTMERYDPSYFNQGQANLFSRETWQRIRADGNAEKSALEIMDLYPTKAWTRSKSRKAKAEGQQ
ncbi:hypothetical protein P3G55_20815 [Leptospira sp. 96542]|nr:hypothetical protein [Leptospira sp. 96542]